MKVVQSQWLRFIQISQDANVFILAVTTESTCMNESKVVAGKVYLQSTVVQGLRNLNAILQTAKEDSATNCYANFKWWG